MASTLLLEVDRTHLSVSPGGSVEFGLTVQNLTPTVDEADIRVGGIDPSWVTIKPRFLAIFGQEQESGRVIIHPPLGRGQASAGSYLLTVQAISREHPEEVGEATLRLEIHRVGDYQLELQKEAGGQQEGSYELRVRNRSNADLRARFTARDEAETLWYLFTPFQLEVPAYSMGNTTLTVRAKQLTSTPLEIPFEIQCLADYLLKEDITEEAPPRTRAARFLQHPVPRLRAILHPERSGVGSTAMHYTLVVENPASMQTAAQITGSSPDGAFDFAFTPDRVELEAGGSALVEVHVRPRALPGRQQRSFDMQVDVIPESPAVGATRAYATFHSEPAPPPVPEPSLPWRGLAVAAVVLIIAILLIVALTG